MPDATSALSSAVSSPILIVEDDPALRKAMLLMLRLNGHTAVVSAATLAEALQSVDSAAPSHVIVDFNLPDGFGTDLLRHIRAHGMETHVLMITGSADLTIADQAHDLGVDVFLTKPPDWDKITDWLAQS